MLAMLGWKIENKINPQDVHSCVLVCAPHTSNWDFFYTLLAFWKMEIPMKFFIKDDWTKPWYGCITNALGGIGVDRSKRNNLTDYAAALLKNKAERLYLVNSPEATRSYAQKWKKGFYHIALKGEVPIALAFCDYKQKTAGIGEIIDPTQHSYPETLKIAQLFYTDKTGKYPENFNKNIALDENE